MEQAFPTTWRHRTRPVVTARAAAALTLAVVTACALAVHLETVCRWKSISPTVSIADGNGSSVEQPHGDGPIVGEVRLDERMPVDFASA